MKLLPFSLPFVGNIVIKARVRRAINKRSEHGTGLRWCREKLDICKLKQHAHSRLHNKIIKLLLFYYVKLERLFFRSSRTESVYLHYFHK